MSTRTNFPRARTGIVVGLLAMRALITPASGTVTAVATAAATAVLASTATTVAHADELVLAGPHPDLKENALSLQFLFGAGLGDSWSGRGLGIGYGYMLHGPLWLDLQINLRASSCGPFRACGTTTGNDAEVMAGVAWRFRTAIPVVPILRGGVGLLYLYPNGAESAMGLGARAAVALKYYVYDWLGLGIEAALSVGHGYLGQDYVGSHSYAVADMALGAEYQFR